MRPELEEILRLAGGSFEEFSQQVALTKLLLALEEKNATDSHREEALPRREPRLSGSLRLTPLDDDEEEEVVAAMLRLAVRARCDEQRIGPIGVMRAASPSVLIEPLLVLLMEHRKELGPEATRQVLLGLQDALSVFEFPREQAETRHASHVSLVLQLSDPRPAVEELAYDKNDDVAEVARRLRAPIGAGIEYLGMIA